MTADISSPATIPATPDVERVLSRNFRALAKFVAFRLCLIVTLMVGPIACIRLGVVQESTLAALPVVAGLFVLIHTVLRLRFATRIFACKRVLRHYPLTHHSRVVKKEGRGKVYGTVFALRVSIRGQHGAPLMRGVNAAGSTRWPAGFDEGGWVAGDLPYGGVVISPTTDAMLFVKPDDWGKLESRRRELGAERAELARLAGLDDGKWPEPRLS
ncbi:hypothetical protein OG785_10000 [Streptomyces sp. NBC_00006]|uniref:hypothetical protein n=1 Tax=unclassified Streptomyces TaxID=2593676 RepID=UPI00225A3FE1|nr:MULTISPECIES: hypothetical protein [unclassified Streptomyces]MCX5530890.1 hypothetical protein [Streptomyces sp. NBC_00006]